MIRKIGLGLLGLLAVGAIAFFAIAPGYVDRDMNRVDPALAIAVSPEAQVLHDSLTIVDLHADTLLWQRNLLDRADHSHVDLPRLQDGNVALQVFSSVTKTPAGQNYDNNDDSTDRITLLAFGQLQPVRTWFSLTERTLWHAEKLDRAIATSDGQMLGIRDNVDLAVLDAGRLVDGNLVGALLSVEGLHNLEGDRTRLFDLYEAGVRMAGLVHFFDNEVAGSMHGVNKGGLTFMGREVVQQMEDMGMVVDIAHCSHQCVAEVLAMARRPVISSHGGVQATCDENRNLTDEEIRGIAATGGVVGIGFWDGAVCETSPRAIARAMRHVRDLVGIETVALGSDFDGTVTTPFDTTGLAQITQALMDEGFSEDEIRLAMGENAIRVLAGGLSPMQEAP